MTTRGIAPMGDRAVIIECKDTTDAHQVSASLALARRDPSRFPALASVVDVVPGASSVVVIFAEPGPPEARAAAVDGAISMKVTVVREDSPTILVKTTYDGPDLDILASRAGITASDVIDLHRGGTYRVAFLGFMPGFAYLTGLPEVLRAPRRADPRTSVPGGAVAIADEFTAVYPRTSPGGWHIIGHTSASLFDHTRTPPNLLTAGASVRFEPT